MNKILPLLTGALGFTLGIIFGGGGWEPPPHPINQIFIVETTQNSNVVEINSNLDLTKSKIVEFILDSNPKLNPKLAETLADIFIKVSKEYQVPLEFLLAVAYTESRFNPSVVSKANCIGIMQINPRVWLKELNLPNEMFLFDANINIKAGAYILKKYYQQTKSWERALERYFGICEGSKCYRVKVLNRVKMLFKHLTS